MERDHTDLESQMRSMTAELESVRKEAAAASSEQKTAQKQIEMLTKEKGVAMRDNAASYQQSIQMETQVQCTVYYYPCTQAPGEEV